MINLISFFQGNKNAGSDRSVGTDLSCYWMYVVLSKGKAFVMFSSRAMIFIEKLKESVYT